MGQCELSPIFECGHLAIRIFREFEESLPLRIRGQLPMVLWLLILGLFDSGYGRIDNAGRGPWNNESRLGRLTVGLADRKPD